MLFFWNILRLALVSGGVAGSFLFMSFGYCDEGTKYSVVKRDLVLKASGVARSDGVGSRWCGRGTLSVLRSLGLGEGLRGGDGHDWEEVLWEAGWRPMPCSEPGKAPYGSVLVYDSDWRKVGFNRRGTAGGRWGHVEFVGWDEEVDGRVYVSDSPREKPGGTVLDNFTGRAWVPPSFVELFRRSQRRDIPFSGYVYRGRKSWGPGTNYIEGEGEEREFLNPREYVLLSGRRGYFGKVVPEEEEFGSSLFPPGMEEEDIELGPGPLGPNPQLGAPLVYGGVEGFEDGLSVEEFDWEAFGRSYSSVEGWVGEEVIEDPRRVRARLDLLLALRIREAERLLGRGL